jgi:soluble lytic murein transglycosylase-like protein
VRKAVILIATLLLVSYVHASENFCYSQASHIYRVDEGLLRSIAWVESHQKVNIVNTNANGTRDIGVMQINSSHLQELSKYSITEKELHDPCVNIKVGAWILANSIYKYGNTWRAVGAYNASAVGGEQNRKIYAAKVRSAMNARLGSVANQDLNTALVVYK